MAAETTIDLQAYKRSLRRRVEIRAGDGEPLVVSWQPDALNDAYIRSAVTMTTQLDAITDEEMPSRRLILELVEGLVMPLAATWNLTTNGSPYPLTPANVADLGIPIVRAIVRALQDDAFIMMNLADAGPRPLNPLSAVGPVDVGPKASRGDC